MSLLLIINSAVLLSCTTIPPKKFYEENEGTWKAKAIIQEKAVGNQKAKNHTVNLKFKAVKNKKIRMDVTSILGTHEASFLLTGSQIQFLMVRERKFYEGHATKRAMKRIVSFPFDPRFLHNILFDTPISRKSWTCMENASGFIDRCNALQGIKSIHWSDRKGLKKTVTLNSTRSQLKINFYDFEPKVESPKASFYLKKPRKFKKIPL